MPLISIVVQLLSNKRGRRKSLSFYQFCPVFKSSVKEPTQSLEWAPQWLLFYINIDELFGGMHILRLRKTLFVKIMNSEETKKALA